MQKWPEVIGIGASVYDTLIVVPHYPVEDTKLEGLETKVQGGGPCATALVAAQKLGVSTAYVGTVGDDPFGRFLMADLKKWGVDIRYVQCIPDCTSFHSVVLLNRQTHSRTCIWSRGSVPQLACDHIEEELFRHAKVLHLDGHMLEAALAAAQQCRKHGVHISYDAGSLYPGVERLLPHVDWLIPSEEFALRVTGLTVPEQAAQKLYDTYHPQLVVVTQGVCGGILVDEKGMRRYQSYSVEVKDTNGCGDTFHGAFVAGKIYGMDNDAACQYASAAAALKCTRLGARSAMATDEECREFLRKQP